MKFPTKLATVLLLQAALLHNALYAYAFVEEFNLPPQGRSVGWQVPSGSADIVSGVAGANGTALRLNTAQANVQNLLNANQSYRLVAVPLFYMLARLNL